MRKKNKTYLQQIVLLKRLGYKKVFINNQIIIKKKNIFFNLIKLYKKAPTESKRQKRSFTITFFFTSIRHCNFGYYRTAKIKRFVIMINIGLK